jgi:hypothetical protein
VETDVETAVETDVATDVETTVEVAVDVEPVLMKAYPATTASMITMTTSTATTCDTACLDFLICNMRAPRITEYIRYCEHILEIGMWKI